ncbi:MAG: aminomethyl-transferring glycine dehydrogenase subunit GcvPB, partial [Candidatus Poseidoniaceae archaeon]
MSNLFEFNGAKGQGYSQPAPVLPESSIVLPASLARKSLPRWPRLSEPEMVRHYTWLSKRNFGIDTGFYPLGSCTMKHNPRVNEVIAQIPGIADIHPHQPEHHIQGLLAIFYEMQYMLEICSGMDQVTLQPVAGAQGEFTAVRCVQEYFRLRGETQRTKVIVPDSAHGTNPASAAMCGFEIVEIPSKADGRIDLEALRAVADETTAVMMITNPNTLGLFEPDILEASAIVHGVGGQMYYDGANFNAILGITSPGLMGFDAVHFNLHKTFSQPHGGGGPGSGPIGVKSHLAEFLPGPLVEQRAPVGDESNAAIDNMWYGWYQPKHTIGKVQQWHGNAGAIIRCWAYYRRYGRGLKTMSEHAVLNANYLR